MPGRLSIDLQALVANYRIFREASVGGDMAAVVKADAYGLGVEAVAGALWRAGCTSFFVADCSEGIRLRRVLADAQIFVFEGPRQETIAALLQAGLTPVLNQHDQLRTWQRMAGGAPAAVHLDTGMHRLGFPADVDPADFSGVALTLLMTHLACADEPAHPLNQLQLQLFAEAAARFRVQFPDLRCSIGNSAAVLGGAEMERGLGRPGIGLYGGNPLLGAASPVRPVVTLEGQVLQVRRVGPGESIGYGATFQARAPMDVAVVGIGYADGLPRLLSNRGEAYCRGRRCAIVGRVSMDLTAVDVTGLAIAPGDWLEFMGEHVSLDEVAVWAQTIPYEILTGLGPRLQRRYLSSAQST